MPITVTVTSVQVSAAQLQIKLLTRLGQPVPAAVRAIANAVRDTEGDDPGVEPQ